MNFGCGFKRKSWLNRLNSIDFHFSLCYDCMGVFSNSMFTRAHQGGVYEIIKNQSDRANTIP